MRERLLSILQIRLPLNNYSPSLILGEGARGWG